MNERPEPAGQLSFDIERPKFPDRNLEHGGRSFYFFDLDDNVWLLPTKIILFEKDSGAELEISTNDFARIAPHVGKSGHYASYEVVEDDRIGSFRRFRDHEGLSPQPLVEDLDRALADATTIWRGPSWDFFHHAVFNQRPSAFITARGHSPTTIKRAMWRLVETGVIPHEPNYLAIFPVTHPETRAQLGDADESVGVPELKHRAIHAAVEMAMQQYGENPHHRFGMSDDDPHNVKRVVESFRLLKSRYAENRFFVIDSSKEPMVRNEVRAAGEVLSELSSSSQLELLPARPK